MINVSTMDSLWLILFTGVLCIDGAYVKRTGTDVLQASTGTDVLQASTGNDVLQASTGNDVLQTSIDTPSNLASNLTLTAETIDEIANHSDTTSIQGTNCKDALRFLSTSTDVVLMSSIPPMSAFTICIWVKTDRRHGYATLLSYAVPGNYNELLMYDSQGLRMAVKGQAKTTNRQVDDGTWHHVCFTWTSQGGRWVYYDNGDSVGEGDGLKANEKINGGGNLALGQEHDALIGGYDPKQAFTGILSYFNMWSTVLTPTEIVDAMRFRPTCGDIFTWNSALFNIKGNVVLECGRVYDTLVLPTANTDVAVKSPIPQLSALTACVWMRSDSVQTGTGTLVSYAVTGSDNEMIMYDTSGMRIFIRAKSATTNLSLNDKKWHHVCVTWSSHDGSWAYYDNGAFYAGGVDLSKGSSVRGGGTLVLGQEQDSIRGGYSVYQAFTGELRSFNLWSKVLNPTSIAVISKSCTEVGNIIRWNPGLFDVKGDAKFGSAKSLASSNSMYLMSKSTDVAVMTRVPELSALTACMWVKTAERHSYAVLISYAVPSSTNELLLFLRSGLELVMKGQWKKSQGTFDDGRWHHVCITWSSHGGKWAHYKDGTHINGGMGFNTGKQLIGGGSLILGQDQDGVRSKYDVNQALKGHIAHFNVWSSALSSSQVSGVWKDCSLGGNVFTWDTALLDINGDVILECSDVCASEV